ncbi:Bax inhibitor-1/YccA family protein [Actinokineospora sp. NBRC 105648]|uniref:Bax inhibitor-1/YccA family protein n=1 Tax=Actinokineospora sp. NBRC 105648 TaxID=3032206 RepID=UPI0024A446EA|nr:Bax inhibitor-1/YccA family protein [Actinokineospora sp. NBRC 105648]GLZ39870.1 membrane protein [Actinokineospora sp. NBRC 105648]
MRSTSNPAFRKLPSGGYAGFQPQAQGYQQPGPPGYGGYPAPPAASNDRPMTVDDVVTKTATTLGVALVIGVITAIAVLSRSVPPYPLVIGGAIVGLVLSLVVIFKQSTSPALILAYSAAEGVFLGAITGVFEAFVPGIAFQAILGTALVFVTMLVVYKTGAVKVTPKLTKWIIGATVAAAGLMLVNLVLSLFGVNTGLREAGPLGIGISLLFIGIAAFNFLLDFDMADQAIRSGTPAKFAWYVAFGLMTTLVWLYLEILRLLYMLQSSE